MTLEYVESRFTPRETTPKRSNYSLARQGNGYTTRDSSKSKSKSTRIRNTFRFRYKLSFDEIILLLALGTCIFPLYGSFSKKVSVTGLKYYVKNKINMILYFNIFYTFKSSIILKMFYIAFLNRYIVMKLIHITMTTSLSSNCIHNFLPFTF